MSDALPLRGRLVLDLSQGIAGPSCGMAMAELGDRDFTAERRGAVVVSMADGSDPNADPSAGAEERERERRSRVAAAEATHRDKLKVPRRPPWTRETPPEVLEQNERRARNRQ